MNRLTKRLLATASLLAIIFAISTSCEKQSETNASNLIRVTGQIGAHSRINESSFLEGDEVSLFAVKYTGSIPNIISHQPSTYVNNQLSVFMGGYFAAVKDGEVANLYYPSDGSNTDIYALYPYTPLISDFEALPIAVPQVQDASNWFSFDYLMAKATDLEPSPVPCNLLFSHLLAKVEISVKLTGFEALTAIQDSHFDNFVLDATFDITSFQGTSVATSIGSTTKSITPNKLVDAKPQYNSTFEMMVPEQTIPKGTKIATFQLNNYNQDVYEVVLKNDFFLQAGKNNVLNINLNAGSSSNIETGHGITEWGETIYDIESPERVPEFKFIVVIVNPSANTDVRNTRAVKTGVNGNRTFEMTNVVYSDNYQINESTTGPAVAFEFKTDGNSPSELPFTINDLYLFTDYGSSILDASVAEGQKVTINTPALTPNVLYLDLATNTFSFVKID